MGQNVNSAIRFVFRVSCKQIIVWEFYLGISEGLLALKTENYKSIKIAALRFPEEINFTPIEL